MIITHNDNKNMVSTINPPTGDYIMQPKISVIALGGTIAMQKSQTSAGVMPELTARDLIDAVPQLADVAQIDAQTFCVVPSGYLTFAMLEDLLQEIDTQIKNGAGGIVITQGTDTIEETSYFLDLLADVDVPIVVTGAMRNPSRPGADGPANILGAVQLACSADAKDTGVLVLLNDEIHCARYVRKSHTSNLATFKSEPLGSIGWIAEDEPRIFLKPKAIAPIIRSDSPKTVHVPLVKIGLDDSSVILQSLLNQQGNSTVDGLVIEAYGGGHVPDSFVDVLEHHAQNIPVILTSRTGQGEALTKTYGYKGAEIDLLERGLISAGHLDGCHSRILLSILLRHHHTNIPDYFKIHGYG